MAKLVINSYEEFASHLGEKLGESDWLQIDQDRINLRGICKTSIKFTIEIEGQRKPALSGIAQFLYYFEN